MSHRSYLKKEITLYGESNGKLFERTFSIARVISEGADGICYEAFYRTSGKGVLKEFYPDKYVYLLERNQKKQLGISCDFKAAAEDFAAAKKKFLEPYNMLLEVKQSSKDRDISSFVPHFEIYHGSDAEGDGGFEGTVYIWTPEPELETFDKICRDIHKHPNVRPERKLVTVLAAVQTLAKCVCALHSAGIVHRDIKPSNFGFIRRRDETLTQALSMFDIDSLCSIWEENPETIVSEGYTEPEAGYREFSNQTDIYSIGATLFTAVVVTDETEAGGYLYHEEYFNRLKEMVSGSRLITASEANSHPRLRNILVNILRNCLCGRRHRYRNCEALIADINEALFYALPPEIARKSRRGERWVLSEAGKSLDAGREKSSALAILYTLYEHPLYSNLEPGGKDLNVLVAGFRNYGQKFLDACLQIGQIRGIRLNVLVVSDDDTDREIYLSERPALSDFFDIGDKHDPNSYGHINFISRDFGSEKISVSDLISGIRDAAGDTRFHYAFFSLGDDAVNIKAAAAFRKTLKPRNGKTTVCYTCESEEKRWKSAVPELTAIQVNRGVRRSGQYKDLERMAFNTHLIWEKSLNLNYQLIKKEFRKPYNHDACVSNAISVKYKLASLGIDLDSVPADEAARRFRAMISEDNETSGQIRDELIWIEHRRWVTEKLCQGWTCMTDLEKCVTGHTKDEQNKKHVCLVKSRPDQMLRRLCGDAEQKWDTLTGDEYEALDELDKLSVRLHRVYAKKSASVRKSKLLRNTLLSGIKAGIEGNSEAVRAFSEWYSCINCIWNGDRTKVRLYRSRKETFTEAAGLSGTETYKAIVQQVKAFDSFFHPVLSALEYRDWKQKDTDLVDNIPFILTYTEKITLIIPFNADPGADNSFSNIAAATLISPERIIYLYQAENSGDMSRLLKTLEPLVSYMDDRSIKASLEFVIAAGSPDVRAHCEDDILRAGRGRVKSVRVIDGTFRSAGEELFSCLPEPGKGVIAAAGQSEIYPWYIFDPGTMEFGTSRECGLFSYIRKDPYITAKDIALFDESVQIRRDMPEFSEDYLSLWDKYREDPETWRRLCVLADEYTKSSDRLAEFSKKESAKKPASCRYIMPAFSWSGVSELTGQLEKRGLISDSSVSAGDSTDTCVVRFTDLYGNKDGYDRLFASVYCLSDPAALIIKDADDGSVGVWFDNLIVSNMPVDTKEPQKLKDLLRYLEKQGYLIAVRYDSSGVSFTYSSAQVKRLLTSPSGITELYCYHYARDLDIYDDVALAAIHTDDSALGDINCCIMTDGFSSIIVPAGPDGDTGTPEAIKKALEGKGINSSVKSIIDV